MTVSHAYTIQRARTVARLLRAGLTLETVASQLGVTARTAARYHAIARNLPEEPAMPTTRAWDHQALCRKITDPAWFFPPSYDNATPEVKAAKNVCRGCPVVDTCRDFALSNPDLTKDGIWGCMTPTERDRARKAANTSEGIAA